MASRSAVMISGERSANWASSFLRSAGASWAAAALRWMTRPARSSSTAGSGMPATTALTAAASTGLAPRVSSREAAVPCSRQGTRAAAAMQTNTTTARTSDNSSSATRTDSDSAAARRMMAEWRSRSGHGEKKDEEVGASRAISPASPRLFALLAGIATLPHIGCFPGRLCFQRQRRLAQPLRPGADDKLPKRQQDYRDDKGRNIVKQAEQQHPGEQFLAVHLPEADQHRGIEHPEPAGRVAGKAQERCRDENHRHHDEAE